MITVSALRSLLAGYPDDMPVVLYFEDAYGCDDLATVKVIRIERGANDGAKVWDGSHSIPDSEADVKDSSAVVDALVLSRIPESPSRLADGAPLRQG